MATALIGRSSTTIPTKTFLFERRNCPTDVEKIKQLLKTDLALYAIDVNSKFETSPAQKDIATLSRFKKNSMNYNVDEKGYYGDLVAPLYLRCYTLMLLNYATIT